MFRLEPLQARLKLGIRHVTPAATAGITLTDCPGAVFAGPAGQFRGSLRIPGKYCPIGRIKIRRSTQYFGIFRAAFHQAVQQQQIGRRTIAHGIRVILVENGHRQVVGEAPCCGGNQGRTACVDESKAGQAQDAQPRFDLN